MLNCLLKPFYRKGKIFLYVQAYYRAFMKSKDINNYQNLI